LQLAWQFASAMHIGGVISPSHFGAVYITLQPPLQLTMAPQLTLAIASSLQLPVHLPLHEPSQCAGLAGVYMQTASHWPLHVPEQLAIPPAPVAVPLHVP